MNLEPLDYKILEYVSLHDAIPKADLEKHFQNIYSVRYRIDRLARPLFNETFASAHPNFARFAYRQNVLFEEDNNIHISDYGRTMLQDFLELRTLQAKKEFEDKLLRIIPIVISFIALIVSIYALGKQP